MSYIKDTSFLLAQIFIRGTEVANNDNDINDLYDLYPVKLSVE
jgi:hypothetical protein